MLAALQQVSSKIDARNLRERVLIFVTLLAVVFLLWQLLVQSAIDNTTKTLHSEQAAVDKNRQELEAKIASLTLSMASDPAIGKRKNIDQLQTSIAQVETRLAGLSQGLIAAGQLPKVLQDVLTRTTSIRLLEVRTLPVQELQLPGLANTPTPTPATSSNGAGVYKHGVLLRVSGSYAELLKLLRDIEALEWKFYWESLDYTVKSYPEAVIDIQVFTLSSEEGLLGV